MIWTADPQLAAMAATELASRRKHFPAMIDRGEIDRDEAEAEILAWRVIASLFALDNHGEAATSGGASVLNPLFMLDVDVDLSWSQLEGSAARALASLAERAKAKPDDRLLAARLPAVRAIHVRIAAHRAFWTGGRPAEAERAAG